MWLLQSDKHREIQESASHLQAYSTSQEATSKYLLEDFSMDKESAEYEELNRIYFLDTPNYIRNNPSPELIAMQNDPKNLQALSDFFAKQESYDSNITLNFVEELPKNFHFPQQVEGGISLPNLKKMDALVKLPQKCNVLFFPCLEALEENTIFPEECRELKLSAIKFLPKTVQLPYQLRFLSVPSLEDLPSGFKFPDGILSLTIGVKRWTIKNIPETLNAIDFVGLQEMDENIVFPREMGYIDFGPLGKLPANVQLPEKLYSYLAIDNITQIEPDTKFPKEIGEHLRLHSLVYFPKLSDNVVWPEKVPVIALWSALNVFERDYKLLRGRCKLLRLPDRTVPLD